MKLNEINHLKMEIHSPGCRAQSIGFKASLLGLTTLLYPQLGHLYLNGLGATGIEILLLFFED
jgi:hypothetical protein